MRLIKTHSIQRYNIHCYRRIIEFARTDQDGLSDREVIDLMRETADWLEDYVNRDKGGPYEAVK